VVLDTEKRKMFQNMPHVKIIHENTRHVITVCVIIKSFVAIKTAIQISNK